MKTIYNNHKKRRRLSALWSSLPHLPALGFFGRVRRRLWVRDCLGILKKQQQQPRSFQRMTQNILESWGAIHSNKIPTGPTGKSGPPQKVDPFFRNFSGWTEPIHWVLDRNFRKFAPMEYCRGSPASWNDWTRQFIYDASNCLPQDKMADKLWYGKCWSLLSFIKWSVIVILENDQRWGQGLDPMQNHWKAPEKFTFFRDESWFAGDKFLTYMYSTSENNAEISVTLSENAM